MINFFNYHNDILDRNELRSGVEHITNYSISNEYDYTSVMHIIAREPYYAYCYAKYVIKGRWLKAEPYIMKSPVDAYMYSRDILKRRWLKAEPYIMKSPHAATFYAKYVMGCRWKEAETVIMNIPSCIYDYARHVLKERWLEAEHKLNDYEESYSRWFNISGGLL